MKQQRRDSKQSNPKFRQQRERYCFFCKNKIEEIDYKDINVLKRFVSDKGKIKSRRTTGVCVQHQHRLARSVKRARQMALLSYTGKPAA